LKSIRFGIAGQRLKTFLEFREPVLPDFSHYSTLPGYVFNLRLSGYSIGTYYLQFTAGDDPTLHNAQFEVK